MTKLVPDSTRRHIAPTVQFDIMTYLREHCKVVDAEKRLAEMLEEWG